MSTRDSVVVEVEGGLEASPSPPPEWTHWTKPPRAVLIRVPDGTLLLGLIESYAEQAEEQAASAARAAHAAAAASVAASLSTSLEGARDFSAALTELATYSTARARYLRESAQSDLDVAVRRCALCIALDFTYFLLMFALLESGALLVSGYTLDVGSSPIIIAVVVSEGVLSACGLLALARKSTQGLSSFLLLHFVFLLLVIKTPFFTWGLVFVRCLQLVSAVFVRAAIARRFRVSTHSRQLTDSITAQQVSLALDMERLSAQTRDTLGAREAAAAASAERLSARGGRRLGERERPTAGAGGSFLPQGAERSGEEEGDGGSPTPRRGRHASRGSPEEGQGGGGGQRADTGLRRTASTPAVRGGDGRGSSSRSGGERAPPHVPSMDGDILAATVEVASGGRAAGRRMRRSVTSESLGSTAGESRRVHASSSARWDREGGAWWDGQALRMEEGWGGGDSAIGNARGSGERLRPAVSRHLTRSHSSSTSSRSRAVQQGAGGGMTQEDAMQWQVMSVASLLEGGYGQRGETVPVGAPHQPRVRTKRRGAPPGGEAGGAAPLQPPQE